MKKTKPNEPDEQKYMVNWKKHTTHFSSAIRDLLDSKTLTDMTLIVDGDEPIPCHKIVLASNSEYFRNFILSSPDTKSIVLYGIKHVHMKAILDYMYTGEMQLPSAELEEVTRLTKLLKIKGLNNEIDDDGIKSENDDMRSSCMPVEPRSNSVMSGASEHLETIPKVKISSENASESSSSLGNMELEKERHR